MPTIKILHVGLFPLKNNLTNSQHLVMNIDFVPFVNEQTKQKQIWNKRVSYVNLPNSSPKTLQIWQVFSFKQYNLSLDRWYYFNYPMQQVAGGIMFLTHSSVYQSCSLVSATPLKPWKYM